MEKKYMYNCIFWAYKCSSNPKPSDETQAADCSFKFHEGSGGGFRVQNHYLTLV